MVAGQKLLRVAITHGDINGINYEILFKVFSDERILELFVPIIYGSIEAEHFWRKHLCLEKALPWQVIKTAQEARPGVVNFINIIEEPLQIEIGKEHRQAGDLAYIALERAVDDILAGNADTLVTAPINKAIMPKDTFPYAGHTQYLEDRAACEAGKSLMIFSSGDCRMALLTAHIPLAEVANSITKELIVDKCEMLIAGLVRDFGITKPRIAVLALNPHASDGGLIGDEEEMVISPAIDALSARGHIVFGPYPADGFWASNRAEHFDGIVAMYHDQGLAPFKTLYMNDGVNITLGLKIVRTSPDHGTGYDIAGEGIASEQSLREAIYLSLDLYRSRQRHEQATKNPLRKTYYNRGRDDERIDLGHSDEHY